MKLQTKPIMYVPDLIGKVSHGLWAWDGGRGWIGVLCVHPICATCVTMHATCTPLARMHRHTSIPLCRTVCTRYHNNLRVSTASDKKTQVVHVLAYSKCHSRFRI